MTDDVIAANEIRELIKTLPPASPKRFTAAAKLYDLATNSLDHAFASDCRNSAYDCLGGTIKAMRMPTQKRAQMVNRALLLIKNGYPYYEDTIQRMHFLRHFLEADAPEYAIIARQMIHHTRALRQQIDGIALHFVTQAAELVRNNPPALTQTVRTTMKSIGCISLPHDNGWNVKPTEYINAENIESTARKMLSTQHLWSSCEDPRAPERFVLDFIAQQNCSNERKARAIIALSEDLPLSPLRQAFIMIASRLMQEEPASKEARNLADVFFEAHLGSKAQNAQPRSRSRRPHINHP